MADVIPPVEWISITTIGFLASIINLSIVITEYKKRDPDDIKFTTKSLKLFSLFSMIFGTLYTLAHVVTYFPVFCHFIQPLQYALISHQYIFIGFYQLSRIYYCFSQSKVYSKKGYPNWVFIIMYVIGISIALNGLIFPLIYGLWVSQCGINNKYEFYPKESDMREQSTVVIWVNISMFSYIIWDITTLLLYVLKVCSFRKYKSSNIEVFNRIMSILRRVLILTACYEIAAMLSTLIGMIRDATTKNGNAHILIRIIYGATFMLTSVVGNYSMSLMQQHNDQQYNQFLRRLGKVRLHYICCCCKSSIVEALILDEMKQQTQSSSSLRPSSLRQSSPTPTTNLSSDVSQKGGDENTMDTRDHSIKQEHSLIQQISLETTMVIDNDKINRLKTLHEDYDEYDSDNDSVRL